MIRKTLLSVVVGGLFVTPTLAADNAQPVRAGFQLSGPGQNGSYTWFLTAGNLLDQTAVDIQTNSQGAGVGDFDYVAGKYKVTTIRIGTEGGTVADMGNLDFEPIAGKAVTVNGTTGSWKGGLLLSSSAHNISEKAEDRKVTVNLHDSTLTGIVIEHGGVFGKVQTTNKTAYNTNTLNLKHVTIDGDIKNADASNLRSQTTGKNYPDGDDFKFNGKTYYLDRLDKNVNAITLTDGSVWTGNLTTTTAFDFIKNENTVTLTDSAWTGHVADKNDVTTVTLKNSTWTVTPVAPAAAANLRTASAPAKTDVVEKLTSDRDSLVVLQKGAKLTTAETAGDLNLKFLSLEGTTADLGNDKANTTLIADANLNDGKTDWKALADGMRKNVTTSSDNGIEDFAIEQGLLADGVSGLYDAKTGESTVTTVNTNTNVATIGEIGAIGMMQWRSEADDLNRRMGELRDGTADNGLWVRTYGGQAETTLVENDFVGVQFGLDRNVATGADKTFVGAALSYTKGDAKFTNGTGDNAALGVTGYATWLFESGSYLDVSAKFGRLKNEFDLNTQGFGKLAGDYTINGMAVGIEAGHRFPLSNLVYVEPQIAFTASKLSDKTFDAGKDVKAEQDGVESYVARAGIVAGLSCPDNMGNVWVKASVLHDFKGEAETRFAAKDHGTNVFRQDFGGSWYELGLGANVNLAKNLKGYADFEYAAGGEIEMPYTFSVGLRYTY